jgi:hypothetical protein
MGIREREAKSIAERKKHLVSILADVATVGAERMSEKIGKASLRDAAIGTGVAVDKMLALTVKRQPADSEHRHAKRRGTRRASSNRRKAGCDSPKAHGVLRNKAVAAEARAPSVFSAVLLFL